MKKKPKSVSPTQRTLKYYRELGYVCAITEHWNSFIKIRQDLFGFCDILALKENETICVQATTTDHSAERVHKIEAHDNYPIVKSAGWKIIVMSWRKLLVKKGGKAVKWTEKIVEL